MEFAPDSQVPANKLGALTHACQAEVPLAPACIDNILVNSLSVVPDPQPELPSAIPDFHLNPARSRVAVRIAQSLDCDPVHFVLKQRSQTLRHAFHINAKSWRMVSSLIAGEFLTEGAYHPGEVVGRNRG
jgi:hypothetical protein